MNDDVIGKLKFLIKEIMGIDTADIDLDKEISKIPEWDSFNNLMLISRCQEEFNVDFTAEEIERTKTVMQIFKLVEGKAKGESDL